MATQLQLRRGTLAQHNSFTGAQGEITVVTDDWSVRVHDGLTVGGLAIGGGAGGGASALSELSDVSATGGDAPADGDVLVYDSSLGKWKPGAGGGGGGGGASLQVNRFLASGTWTKPANLQFVEVVVVSPGSGGGAGMAEYVNNFYVGGWGGFAGLAHKALIHADELPSTVSVVVGAAGLGEVYNPSNYPGIGGGAGGSCSFGDFVYSPTGVPGISPLYSSNTFWNSSTRTDDYYPLPEYGGSGGASLYGHNLPGQPVASPWDTIRGALNHPIGPGAGAAGATIFLNPSWNYGTLSNVNNNYVNEGMHGAEGFASEKPPIVQPAKASYPGYGMGNPQGRARQGANGIDVNPVGGSYNKALASLGGAGALTDQELAALKRTWKGCGGGGGGMSYTSSTGELVYGHGGAGSFPGGGGGGGAAAYSGGTPGSGGDGGAGVVYVYSYIGASPFAYA